MVLQFSTWKAGVICNNTLEEDMIFTDSSKWKGMNKEMNICEQLAEDWQLALNADKLL